MSEKLTSAFELYRLSKKYSLSLSYRGPFVDALTHRIIDITENTIANQQGLPKINRKVSFLLVECFQNIIKHGKSLTESDRILEDEGVFHFKNEGGAYIINSINFVKNDEVEQLQQAVEYINSLDKKSLKEMYKQKLQMGEISEKGGAGLGLIEIARKSGQKLVYEIERIDDNLSSFHQQILFLLETKNDNPSWDAIQATKEHYKLLKQNKILLQYKGDFSQKSILPLLNIVEANIGKTQSERTSAKKVGHVLIEALQNISKHGLEEDGQRNGIFIIGRDGGKVFVLAGNVIHKDEKCELQNRLEYLLSLSPEQLVAAHREKMRNSVNLTDKSKSGLGLIEIAKSSTEKISFQFDKLNQNTMFFSIYVNV